MVTLAHPQWLTREGKGEPGDEEVTVSCVSTGPESDPEEGDNPAPASKPPCEEDLMLRFMAVAALDGPPDTRILTGQFGMAQLEDPILQNARGQVIAVDGVLLPGLAHTHLLGAHLGIEKTRERIGNRFHWPGVKRAVEDYCRVPFERMAMDLVGPLVKTARGHQYILFIVDYTTRYPEAKGIAAAKGEDQCVPSTNGLVERFNKTLKQMLKKVIERDRRNWDQLLPHLMFSTAIPDTRSPEGGSPAGSGNNARNGGTHSEWSSPIVLVPKPDGTISFCNDFRGLNEVSKFDAYPVPQVDELIDRFGMARYVSTLDLMKGYWQVSLAAASREKTAFSTPGGGGLYHYRVLPFGLHGAPATFQRLMDRVLRPHSEYAAAYLGDIIVHSDSWESHLCRLQVVVDALRDAGLTANPHKCKLGYAEMEYLGYQIGRGNVKPQEKKSLPLGDGRSPEPRGR
eukprot:XP_013989370.1 PREDICTED: uncharacterized protein LOC106566074 [Salmo salar]